MIIIAICVWYKERKGKSIHTKNYILWAGKLKGNELPKFESDLTLQLEWNKQNDVKGI